MGVPPSNRYGTGPTHAHCLHEPPVLFAVCCNLTTKFPQERIELLAVLRGVILCFCLRFLQ